MSILIIFSHLIFGLLSGSLQPRPMYSPEHLLQTSSVCSPFNVRDSSFTAIQQRSYFNIFWLQTGRPGFDPRQRQRILPLASVSRPALEAHPASCPMGNGGPFPGVKRGRVVTLTMNVEVKYEQELDISSPLWRLHGVEGQLFYFSR
jgi:hypothetical protein